MAELVGNSSNDQVNVKRKIFRPFAIQWYDLSYKFGSNYFTRKLAKISFQNIFKEKFIIKNVKGTIKSGELAAIMGPSGAGKSTLLECITGFRRQGRCGIINYHGSSDKLNVALIPQQDSFFGVLTVKESIIFASKLQNSTRAKNGDDYLAFMVPEDNEGKRTTQSKLIDEKGFHEDVAFNIMSLLGLEHISDVRTKNISGGQRKRLSIAQELVSKPDVLILDEPTSGLDSSTSLQLINLLQKLTQQKFPMAIVCTIHQPSPKLFNLFHRVYILSVIGKCIYEGPPVSIVDHLRYVDIECPIYNNPADFIIEVASGEYGFSAIEKLVHINENTPIESMVIFSDSYTLDEVSVNPKFPFFSHVYYLFHRSLLLIVRNYLFFGFRIISFVFVSYFMSLLFGSTGKYGGCIPDMEQELSLKTMAAANKAAFEENKKVLDNLSLIFFTVAIIQMLSSGTTLISFPTEFSVFQKETRNKWYEISSYFWGLLIADTPFQIICSTIFATIIYTMTEQIQVLWRFEIFLVTSIMVALIGQCQGLIIGAIFIHNLPAAVYIGGILVMPLLLFSGFFVKFDRLPDIVKPITNLNYVKFCFEAIVISIYGFKRCDENVKERIESMQRLLLGWIGRMMTIFYHALEEESDYNDYVDGKGTNGSEILPVVIGNKEYISSFSNTIVNTIMAGVGAGAKDKNGNPISGVMSFVGIEDQQIYGSLQMVIFFVFSYRILTYLFIRWKVNQKH